MTTYLTVFLISSFLRPSLLVLRSFHHRYSRHFAPLSNNDIAGRRGFSIDCSQPRWARSGTAVSWCALARRRRASADQLPRLRCLYPRSLHQNPRHAIAENTPVLLLLRGDFRASERALADLKKHGRTVVVSLKETGLHQIAQQLCDYGRLSRFMKIVAQADGCIATTPEAMEIYQSSRWSLGRVAFIPTPCPVEDQIWNFCLPPDEQSGIFVGTREWDVP